MLVYALVQTLWKGTDEEAEVVLSVYQHRKAGRRAAQELRDYRCPGEFKLQAWVLQQETE